MSVTVSVCIMLILLMGEVGCTEHYCSRHTVETIRGETQGSIRTLYRNDSHYNNNQKCAWIIDAGANHRVEFTVISSNLQWAPTSAICTGYDHVAIRDVRSANSSGSGAPGEQPGANIVLQWCGTKKPLGAISTGRYVRVEFMSDDNNPYSYTGVYLTFQTFSTDECAPSWKTGPTNVCYKMLDKKIDWRTAQQECNAERANLVSISEETEFDFLMQTYRGSYTNAWIGLSDISKLGSYSWIDRTEFKVNKLPVGQQPDTYRRCVAFRFDQNAWHLYNCDSFLTNPLCKANVGNTQLFPIPKDEGKKVYEIPIAMIAGIVAGVIVLVIIIACICWYRKKYNPRYQVPELARDTAATTVSFERNPGGGGRTPGCLPPPYAEVMADQPVYKN